jgi:hypothetical protein
MLAGDWGSRLTYYRFHEADGSAVAITDDITGGKLPRPASGWKADGLTTVVPGGRQRFGVEPAVIIAGIEQDGYFLATLQPPGGR